jgi:hypothetical protein
MAQKVNLVIDQGTTFTSNFLVNDDDGNAVDLSIYTARSQLRKHYTSSNSTSFTVTANSTGYVTLTLSANTTTGLAAGRYVYDVELVDASNVVSRILEGMITVTPEVTR